MTTCDPRSRRQYRRSRRRHGAGACGCSTRVPDCRVDAVSRLYRTPPWGKTDQSFFFNACAAVDTTLAPEALLDVCLGIERDMKRERIERWGPRTIDIDMLTYRRCRAGCAATGTAASAHDRAWVRADAACRFRRRISSSTAGRWRNGLREADVAGHRGRR